MTVRHPRRRPVTAIAAVLAGAALVLASGPGARAEEVVGPPGTFTLEGAGWGHGVGMSQWGAFGMARAVQDDAETAGLARGGIGAGGVARRPQARR